ncbi:MAG: MoxR family ATPase [Oscillospiraceae bacterium]|jgi:hypothetical protein|nr:MoxR family ATPase [Oscillospiraceae bacterium]
MNIKDAKIQIKNAMRAYFTKDEFGGYIIPVERQRPVFLIGPPGIGKTAVMAQIAQELGVGLLSYSMTHHTRQSALGLPFITSKIYDGAEYRISEYTMSEIIASVYELMETTGVKEGILFLDEINCVSETLAPAMLQFLQYKVFGRHRVPDGWIVVTAGNPPEYNKSVREFDIVTWDRLKRIDVEPDFEVWKEYAYDKGVHPSIMTYLEAKKSDFYDVESTVGGKRFVTARGWVDLSDMLYLYERNGISADETLIAQYLQHSVIAKSFAVYYDLFGKYRSDYQVDKILCGQAPQEIKNRAAAAKFDERLSLLGLLLDSVGEEIRAAAESERTLAEVKKIKNSGAELSLEIARINAEIESGRKALNLSSDELRVKRKTLAILENSPDADLESETDAKVKSASATLDNLFKFCEEVFGDSQEMVILVTELTVTKRAARFIAAHGCDAYFRHNKSLLFHERGKQLLNEIEKLEQPD